MTSTDPAADVAGPIGRLSEVRTLSEQMPRFMRLIHARQAQPPRTDAGPRGSLLLFPLVRLGPLRQSALAELVHADPSTVSRHVAGWSTRAGCGGWPTRPTGGPADWWSPARGRSPGDAAEEREAHLERVTADWPEADLATFTALFGRLLDDLAAALPAPDARRLPHHHPTAGEKR